MNNLHPLKTGFVLLFVACGGEVPTESLPAPIDPAIWNAITCEDLAGMAFTVTYYLDGRQTGTDALRFDANGMVSGSAEKQGLKHSASNCQPDGPGKLIAKEIMTNDAGAYRRWVYSISQGAIDGTMEVGQDDGSTITHTFSGHLTH